MECIDIEVWECGGYVVTADGKEPHAWNKVKVDGIWYYIDAYWTASLKNTDYFLSETLWPDHVLNKNLKEIDEVDFDDESEYKPGFEPIYEWSDDEIHNGEEGTFEDLNYGETFTEAGFGLAWY